MCEKQNALPKSHISNVTQAAPIETGWFRGHPQTLRRHLHVTVPCKARVIVLG